MKTEEVKMADIIALMEYFSLVQRNNADWPKIDIEPHFVERVNSLRERIPDREIKKIVGDILNGKWSELRYDNEGNIWMSENWDPSGVTRDD
jgi:hypothetical protein